MVTPEAVRQHLLAMGYSWKRTRYVPNKAPDPEEEREAREELEGLKKGRRKGEIVLKYLDESGFYLCLPPTHTWTKKGQAHQHRVRSRWGSEGRVNLMGTLRVEGEGHERLEYRMLEGSCDSGEVLRYLDALAHEAQQEGNLAWWFWTTLRFTPPGSSESVRRSGRRGG